MEKRGKQAPRIKRSPVQVPATARCASPSAADPAMFLAEPLHTDLA